MQIDKIKKLELVKNYKYYAMIFPAMLVTFLFVYMSLPGVLLAFKQYTDEGGIFFSPNVGFANFKAFFSSPDFWLIVSNTVILSVMTIFSSMFTAILGALLMNEIYHQKAKKAFQTILYLPTFLSLMIVSRFVGLLFNNDYGLVNKLLELFGFAPYAFYDGSKYWKIIVIFTQLWKGFGNSIIIYLATISGFDIELYEAARIDGGGRMVQMRYITLPLLVPVIMIRLMMSIGNLFSGNFMLNYSLMGNNQAMRPALEIIETYMYRSVMAGPINFGTSAAVGIFQTVMGFIMIFGTNTIVKHINKEYALF